MDLRLHARIDRIKQVGFVDALTLVASHVEVPPRLPQHVLCPLPDHQERTPSCYLQRHRWYCFGCFAKGVLVTTDQGSKPIEEVEIGDRVLTRSGRFMPVVVPHARTYSGEFVTVEAKGLPLPIRATVNHEFFVIRGQRRGVDGSRMRWPGMRGQDRPDPPYEVVKVRADRLTCDDFLTLPLPEQDSEQGWLSLPWGTYEKRKGPSCRSIPLDYPLVESLAWLLGYYVAEGSYCRGLRFTLHLRERSLAQRVEALASELFDLDVAHYEFPDKNTREVLIPHAILGRWFVDLCGAGAQNKRFPSLVLTSPTEVVRAALEGYLAGDGHRETGRDYRPPDVATTVSPTLAYQLMLMGARCSRTVSAHLRPGGPRGGCLHRDSFAVRLGSRPHRTLDGCAVFQVASLHRDHSTETVYNLTVAGDHSYVVNGALVKNCHRGGDVIDFVKAMHGCSLKAAVAHVESALGLDDLGEDELAHLVLAARLAGRVTSPPGPREWDVVVAGIDDLFLRRMRPFLRCADPVVNGIAWSRADYVFAEIDDEARRPPRTDRGLRERRRRLTRWVRDWAGAVACDVERTTGKDRLDARLQAR